MRNHRWLRKALHLFLALLSAAYLAACGDGYEDDDTQNPSPSGIDVDGDGSDAAVDCDDENPDVYPGADEVCNGLDDDCDNDEDDGVLTTYYLDVDGDGFGGVQTEQGCTPPTGYVITAGDCDDTDANVSPGAPEVCDELDNDCDAEIDEGFEGDVDGDGHPDCLDDDADGDGITPAEGDCNDLDNTIYPGATEVCNSLDDNCSGTADEGFDADVDGYKTCTGDCDDGNQEINPGATEVCDELDNDCDGLTDAGVDSDADGYTVDCNPVVESGEDCDDAKGYVYPGAIERCNDLDDDCDGLIDDADTGTGGVTDQDTWYVDVDGDGYGDSSAIVKACVQPEGYAPYAGDCNEDDPYVNPGEVEVCDGIDEDCSEVIDDVDIDLDGFYDQSCESGPETANDCNDDNDDIHPGATDPSGDGIDQDCDGNPDGRYGDWPSIPDWDPDQDPAGSDDPRQPQEPWRDPLLESRRMVIPTEMRL